jgi:gluconolactonase
VIDILRFEPLATGLSYPEGPVVLAGGDIACVETLAGRLTRVGRDGRVQLIAELGGGPNGAAIGPDGRCYVCNNGGLTREDLARFASGDDTGEIPPPGGAIQVVDLATGEFETLYDACDGTPLLSPNDLVFDAAGGFYFTDYGSVKRAPPQVGQVYYAAIDGSHIRAVGAPFERPNGVGLSPDGCTLYVAETSTGRLWRYAILEPGVVRGGEPVLVFGDAELRMDSLAVQADGRVCVACPHNDLVVRVSPGGAAERFATPPGFPSNICFGGPDLRTAYITLLRAGALLVGPWDATGLELNFGPR